MSNRLHLWNIERFLDLASASKRRVSLEQQVILFSPLEKFGLGVEVVELDLVDSGFVLERVTGEFLDPRDVEGM